MNSLRDMMETTFAAAAFAERNLEVEAREILNSGKTAKTGKTATRGKTADRPRPSLKA